MKSKTLHFLMDPSLGPHIDLNQWGQDEFAEARHLLMPHGLPLKAEFIPKRYLIGTNLWIPFGPKRGCNVYPRSDNEWDHLVSAGVQ